MDEFERLIFPGAGAPATEGQKFDAKKGVTKKASEIAKDVAAFANADGGVLAYGVEESTDANGTKVVSGVEDLGDTQSDCRRIEDATSRLLHGLEHRPDVVPLALRAGENVIAVNIRPSARLVTLWRPGEPVLRYPVRRGEGTEYLRPDEVDAAMLGYAARAKSIRLRELIEEAETSDVDLFHVVKRDVPPVLFKPDGPVSVLDLASSGVWFGYGFSGSKIPFLIPYEWVHSTWLGLDLSISKKLHVFVTATLYKTQAKMVGAIPLLS